MSLVLALVLLGGLTAPSSFAQSAAVPSAPSDVPPGPESQPAVPKKDDALFDQPSPYLEYGEFNLSDEEEQETLYYQYGRFFGVSLGAGYETATGNRGKLYSPAIPRFDVKIHYWFDFQLALNIDLFFANHTFNYDDINYKVALLGFGLDVKYYFDVRNMGAAFTFSNPFLIGGISEISMTQTKATQEPDTDSTFSLGFGGGLEFPIVYKKTYFILEAKYFTQNFKDSNESELYSNRVPDLTGGFYTLMAHILFTW